MFGVRFVCNQKAAIFPQNISCVPILCFGFAWDGMGLQPSGTLQEDINVNLREIMEVYTICRASLEEEV